MTIYDVTDEKFKKYGRIVQNIDFSQLVEVINEKTPLPDGVAYEPSVAVLEELPVYQELSTKTYGELEIEIGYCNGHNELLNAVEYLLKPIDEVIRQRVTDSRLADVLVGNLPLYAAEPGRTPFSTHAFIMDFYNQSAFRVAGGSDHIAAALKCVIERNGGKVMVRSKVTFLPVSK